MFKPDSPLRRWQRAPKIRPKNWIPPPRQVLSLLRADSRTGTPNFGQDGLRIDVIRGGGGSWHLGLQERDERTVRRGRECACLCAAACCRRRCERCAAPQCCAVVLRSARTADSEARGAPSKANRGMVLLRARQSGEVIENAKSREHNRGFKSAGRQQVWHARCALRALGSEAVRGMGLLREEECGCLRAAHRLAVQQIQAAGIPAHDASRQRCDRLASFVWAAGAVLCNVCGNRDVRKTMRARPLLLSGALATQPQSSDVWADGFL